MTETLRIVGGAAVDCADGPCGVAGRALVEPTGKSVSHLAVEPTALRGVGRLVPFRLLRASAAGLRLDYSRAEFDALDPDEDIQRVPVLGLSPGTMSLPRLIIDRTPKGTVAVNSETDLRATDGKVGHLLGLVVDAADGRITELLVEEGHFSRRRQISVPAEFISSLAADVIERSLSKSQIESR